MSVNRAKGTAAERLVVDYLRQWWPNVERRALNGANDRGDIAGIPSTVWEIKAGQRLDLSEWMRETQLEQGNAGAALGLLVVRRRGHPVHMWPVIQPLHQAVTLLREAGW